MLTKMRKKGKKGFTLVELIVVIAIIAILAAVAVPTTIHFVEKANISNEQSAIDIRQSLSGIFTDVMTGTVEDFKIAIGATDTLAPELTKIAGANKSIDYIKVTISETEATSSKFTVSYEIIGKEFPAESKLSGAVDGTLTASQLGINATNNSDSITVKYTLTGGAFVASAGA